MEYEIKGNEMPILEITLNAGESMFTESGGMAWMTEGISMETSGRGGGVGGFIGRALSGESLFLTSYEAQNNGARIVFTPEVPGHIVSMELQAGQSIIAQKTSFMCAEDGVELATHFRQKLGAGFFGGEGFIMQKVTGPGRAFFEIGGEVHKVSLGAGEVLKVDPGHVALHDPSVDYDIERVKGIKNIFFGGEGLFLAKLTGPGDVWLQSLPFANLLQAIMARLPRTSDRQG
jgi:uncharacterized protein (TIGR00266 family)